MQSGKSIPKEVKINNKYESFVSHVTECRVCDSLTIIDIGNKRDVIKKSSVT